MVLSNPLFEVRDLCVSINTPRGSALVVDRFSLAIARGDSLGLVGESGSGKTMTALALMGLLPAAARIVHGSIIFEGRDLVGLPERDLQKLRGTKMAIVFQSSRTALNPLMRVGDQIARVLRTRHGLNAKEAHSRAVDILRNVGIRQPGRRALSYPHELSGGMAQRVLIAMMLASDPRLLIADEPTTGLDVTTEAQVFDLLQETLHAIDSALLLITHDLGLVASNCRRLGVMHAGHLVELGSAVDVFGSPKHPYTQGLLSSIPRPDRSSLPMSTLVGSAPNPLDLPQEGCRFLARCPDRMDRCSTAVPLVSVGEGHSVFCHKYG